MHGTNFDEWGNLDSEFPDFQFVLYDDETEAGLSDGIDVTLNEVFARKRASEDVNILCALAAEILPRARANVRDVPATVPGD